MKNILGSIVVLLVAIGFTYGMYYVAKNVSYSLFYESLVLDTIEDQVKSKCLIK